MKLGIQAFAVYLIGKLFVVQIDHRALQWLQQFKESNSRLMRLSLALQPHQFTIKHHKGNDNANADGLSRLKVDAPALRAKKGGRKCNQKDLMDHLQSTAEVGAAGPPRM